MKKRIIIAFTVLMLSVSASFASDLNGNVPDKIASAFSRDFFYASNVNWEKTADFYKVSFSAHEKTLFVFYTEEGEYLGMTVNILADKLPASLQSKISADYGGYWITDLFHFEVKNTGGYLITLENADQKLILKAEGNQGWQFVSLKKKI